LLEGVGDPLNNDLFDKFIRLPSPSSDYSGETVVSVTDDQDSTAEQFLHKNDRSDSLQGRDNPGSPERNSNSIARSASSHSAL
jgi:hypothetical protein